MRELFALAFWGTAALALGAMTVPNHLQGAICADAAAELIEKWGAENTWMNDLYTGEGPRTSRTPSSQVAVWIETRVYPDRHIEALRITPRVSTTVTWDSSRGCVPKLALKRREIDAKRLQGAFTDGELARLVKTGGSGIVYAWSPEMPLSLKAMPAIRKVAEELKLKLTFVLDPHAERAGVAQAARAQGLRASDLMPMESIDLFYRGITQHYPALVVYSRGRITSFAYPGYKEREQYLSYIQEHLK